MSKNNMDQKLHQTMNEVMDEQKTHEILDKFAAKNLEEAISFLAEITPNNLTLDEVLKNNEDEVDHEYLDLVYPAWVDLDAVKARKDNILNKKIEDGNTDWRVGYEIDLANFIIKNGIPVSLNASYYGWGDYRNEKLDVPIVAAFNIKEENWHEFNGTFNTEDDSTTGLSIDVVYENGASRILRYTGTLGSIMRKLLKK